jgi:adenylate kinase family enzyme
MAGRLAERLDLPHVEQDALNWGPNWTMRPNEEFRALVDQATCEKQWVVGGNYSRSRDLVWPRADTIVWLDYSLARILWRLWWRTWRRFLTQEALWNDNRERLWENFFTRDSLFLWVFQTYGRRKREIPTLLAAPEHAHLLLIHHCSPQQAEQWFSRVEPG